MKRIYLNGYIEYDETKTTLEKIFEILNNYGVTFEFVQEPN